ncbi:hypothetical protein FT662_01063 [Candidozyma haemuli var. vulneris]|uniref:Serine/threonine-protein phosphatase n=1 Tax=Candidozyma haemuli TaxID=45357 RepID=A0A2V1AY69_9ASCO|nr:hypothetical protein CXQ85_002776 [[Candida] haemuloni]KAF3992517.1 hypothetical protein FT662_01063 [[Candida] haemuloni var. vulneris]PVH23050.1 hypothetical protein CXQ85_002776 [[Candida] haemuloni]
MGNSPSKNDPLPNSSATSNGVPSFESQDLDQDDTVPPLSRPTGNGSELLDKSLKSFSFQDKQIQNAQPNASHPSNRNSKVTPSVGPKNIPRSSNGTARSGSRKSSSVPRGDLDLEIDASMATAMNGNSSSVRSPKEWLAPSSYQSVNSSSSMESSNGLSVFTNGGETKDESSISSVSSNSPVNYKGAPFLQSPDSLDPIQESSSSSSSTSSSPSDSSKARKSAKSNDSQAIPKFSELGRKLASKASVSSAPSSPPLIPSAKRVDFDIDGVIERLLNVGQRRSSTAFKSRSNRDKLPLTPDEIKHITAKSRSIFLDQPTMLKLSPPVKIVGDIHGQYHDLIRIFNSCGHPPQTNYLFLGDYVDRGYKSLETILLLLCYKIKYPENFFMLRGNHESANITKIYGFYDECKRRLPLISGSHKLWKNFIDVFNSLPIAASINDKIFTIHGGLSPELRDLKQIEQIQRPTDIPDKGLLADLLWSDPDPKLKSFNETHWPKNDRGVSYCFGKKHVDHFLNKFNMDLIVRGHMVVEDGYEFFNRRKLVTVFSAPNYCGEFNNYGAVMSVDKKLCCSFELLKPQ